MPLSAKAIRYLGAMGKLGKRLLPHADEAAKYGGRMVGKMYDKVRRVANRATSPNPQKVLMDQYSWAGPQKIPSGPKRNIFVRGYKKIENTLSPHMPSADKVGRGAFRFDVGTTIGGGLLTGYAAHSYRKDKKKLIEDERKKLEEERRQRARAFFPKADMKIKKVRRTH